MTRRRQPARPHVDDSAFVTWKYRWTGRFALSAEPGSPGAALRKRIARERDRLDSTSAPVDEKLHALEAFIAGLGYEASLRRFIDRMLTSRARHMPAGDFSHAHDRRPAAGRKDAP